MKPMNIAKKYAPRINAVKAAAGAGLLALAVNASAALPIYERIAGCMQSGSKCTCYSDQAAELEVTVAMCKNYVKKGRLPMEVNVEIAQAMKGGKMVNVIQTLDVPSERPASKSQN